jgi:signal transduction histidine kinase
MKTIFGKTRTEKTIRSIYLLAFILLFFSYVVTLFANRQLVKQAAVVEHTNSVIKKLDQVVSKIIDAETGSRGYIITSDIEYLFPYYGAKEKADSFYKELLELTKDHPVQQERLSRFKMIMDKRFEIITFSLKLFDNNSRQMTDTMNALRPTSKKLMDEIRSSAAMMEREENKLLQEREEKMKNTFGAINTITIVSLTIAFSLLFFGFITYMHVSKARKKAQQDIADYQYQLTQRITDLDRANTELIKMRSQEKFAATGRMARAIAHEVRNPLTNIDLATNQLKSEVFEGDENNNFLFDMINRNSGRINHLISDLLNSTKFSELNFEKTDVNDLLDETLQEADDRIVLYKVKIIKNYTNDICKISVDKTKIKIAVLNIIINAIEAMEDKEEKLLTLETKSENNKCKIIISDTGRGMNSESLSRLFEAYFTNKPKGNGLGLTNTQNIILNHNGEISVESTLDIGTSFTITLNFSS